MTCELSDWSCTGYGALKMLKKEELDEVRQSEERSDDL